MKVIGRDCEEVASKFEVKWSYHVSVDNLHILYRVGINCLPQVAVQWKQTWGSTQSRESKSKGSLYNCSYMLPLLRYILGWIEKYKQGVEPYAISLPKKK